MNPLVEQLQSEIRTGKVLAVVGAGVSVGATSGSAIASWTGLLKHGAQYCTKLGVSLPPGWEERTVAQIESLDTTEMIFAAQNIAERLSAPLGGDFRSWLRDSVGALTVTQPAALQAILHLNVPIATTNYDSLISEATGLPPVVWTNPSAAQRWARDDQKGVLHLHGHWSIPDSVVLGIRSYDQILLDEATQSLLRNLLYSRTLLFIGYGGGLNDPNFAALLKWSQRVLSESEYCHYRLVTNSKVLSVRQQHQGDRIRVIGIGDTYEELPAFLQSLGSTPVLSAGSASTRDDQVRKLTESRADLFRRKALLDERKDTISSDEFIAELATIAEALAEMGGTRSAVSMLHSPYCNAQDSLSFSTRTKKGLVLVDLLLRAGEFEFARRQLQALFEACTSDEAAPEITERFWALSAECFTNLFSYDDAHEAFENAIEHCNDDARRLELQAKRDEFELLRGMAHSLLPDEEAE